MALATEQPIAETYRDVERLIYHVCNIFYRKHGGEFEELVGEARIVYMRVYEYWGSEKPMQFTSYLSTCVYRELLKKKRIEKRREDLWKYRLEYQYDDTITLLDTIEVEDEVEETENGELREPEFDEIGLLQNLSEDAATIVCLVLETPAEMLELVHSKGGEGRNWRSCLRDYLRKLGWSSWRVNKSFDEIGEVL